MCTMRRFPVCVMAALALVLIAFRPAIGQPVKHQGAIVKVVEWHLIVKVESDRDVTVHVDADTRITLDGKPAKFADLRMGQEVKLVCEPEGAEFRAKEIQAISK